MNITIPEFPDLPIGTLYCIGRNYAKHIEEMKSERTNEPVVFIKPRSSVIFTNETIKLPEQSGDVHHEVEMVLLIGKISKNIPLKDALGSVKAVAAGLDITARDIQKKAKQNGLPWALSKGFDTFAPIGNFVTIKDEIDLQNIEIKAAVNGKIRQAGHTSEMLFSAAELISYLSSNFTLYPGDLVFTGTPEGVSRILPGDTIEASLQNHLSTLKVYVQ